MGLDQEDTVDSVSETHDDSGTVDCREGDEDTTAGDLIPWLGEILWRLDLEQDQTPAPDSGVAVSVEGTFCGYEKALHGEGTRFQQ